MGDGLRSGSRLTPRRQDAKERLNGSTPLGDFVPLCEKFFEKRAEKPKMAGFEQKIGIWGPETARKRRFQALFHHFSPARPVAARFR